MRCNRRIHGLAAKKLRNLIGESGEGTSTRFNFDTGIPHCAVQALDEGTIDNLKLGAGMSLHADTLANLWYDAKRLAVDYPGGSRTVSIDRIFYGVDHPDRATTLAQNHFQPCRGSFFYPLSYIWELDELPDGDPAQSIILRMFLAMEGAGSIKTDGEGKFWTPLEFFDLYEGDDSEDGEPPTYRVGNGKASDDDTLVGQLTFLGQKIDLFSPDRGATQYGDVIVTIDEEWPR